MMEAFLVDLVHENYFCIKCEIFSYPFFLDERKATQAKHWAFYYQSTRVAKGFPQC